MIKLKKQLVLLTQLKTKLIRKSKILTYFFFLNANKIPIPHKKALSLLDKKRKIQS